MNHEPDICSRGISFRSNSTLSFVRAGYRGNPFLDGRFLNEARKADLSWHTVLRWYLSRNPQKKEKKRDPFRLPVLDAAETVRNGKDMVLWLGHACFLIRMNGFNILTDPCLFDLPFIRRAAALPMPLNDLPRIDYLLLSHSHRDHLDKRSLCSLDLSGGTALVPLGMTETVHRCVSGLEVQEAGWYQRYLTQPRAPEIIFLPSQHWSNRRLRDTNRVLWGSFLVRGAKRSVYFSGDSAYGPHFSMIRHHLGNADICLMPVGAYMPPYIMHNNHMNPREAVDAYRDLEGSVFVPMHYATYDLSDEPPGEPLRILESMSEKSEIPGRFQPLAVGEPLFL